MSVSTKQLPPALQHVISTGPKVGGHTVATDDHRMVPVAAIAGKAA